MNSMKDFVKYLIREEEGQGFVEYSMVAVLISIVAAMLIGNIGDRVAGFYDDMLTVITSLQ